jgi:hypothetical protein
MPKCAYGTCDRDATVTRTSIPHDEPRDYCLDHDPLDDPVVADYFEEVEQ